MRKTALATRVMRNKTVASSWLSHTVLVPKRGGAASGHAVTSGRNAHMKGDDKMLPPPLINARIIEKSISVRNEQ